MHFQQFQWKAVANLVLTPNVHAAQAVVKARMNEGDTTNISFVASAVYFSTNFLLKH